MGAPIANVLVQGASRGIGYQFCKSLLSRQPRLNVIATCRSPDTASHLHGLKTENDNTDRLHMIQVDVNNESYIKEAASYVEKHFGGLDLLINCTGMLHPSGRGETNLRDVDMQGLMDTCRTNAFGSLLMAKHFSKLLQNGGGHIGTNPTDTKRHASVLVNISAKVGSISDNGLGGWYSYRMSKAALNMATRNLGIELGRGRNKVICVALHPGTVDTDLSRPYHKNVKTLFTTEQCVDKLLGVIDSVTLDDSGLFFTYDKQLLPF